MTRPEDRPAAAVGGVESAEQSTTPSPGHPLITLTPEELQQLIVSSQMQVQTQVQDQVQAQVEAQMQAQTQARMQAEAEAMSSEIQTTATTSLIVGAIAMGAGAAAGVALFDYLTKPPITEDIAGTITFALFGLALPFGWHFTRLRDSSLSLPLFAWPIALILRAWFSIIIGLPALAFYLLRALFRLYRARRLHAAVPSSSPLTG